jgi:hypothetical protein
MRPSRSRMTRLAKSAILFVGPTNPDGPGAAGTMRNGSRVHREPIDQLGIQLCPGSIANDYAADFHRGLPTGTPSRLRSRPSTLDSRALHPGPYPPDLSRCHAYGALTLVPHVYLSDLARRTQPAWQYQAVSALSALLPALPGTSRIGLRSAPTKLLRQPGGKDSHLPWFIGAPRRTSASWRTTSHPRTSDLTRHAARSGRIDQQRGEPLYPPIDRGMIHLDATLGQQLLRPRGRTARSAGTSARPA